MEQTPSHPAYSLLSRAQPADKAAEAFKEKVQHRPMILRPTSPDPLSKDARSARRRQKLHKRAYHTRKQKPRRLSAKDRRKLGIHEIPKDPGLRKWETFVPLRQMWWEYMQELLGISPDAHLQSMGTDDDSGSLHTKYFTGTNVGPRLASADYHGAELHVVRSACVGCVGIRGIVLKDTKFTFKIVTEADGIKTVPKNHTIFRFEIPRVDPVSIKTKTAAQAVNEYPDHKQPRPFVFELHGEQFLMRATDRANKKFKSKRMDDL